jgi:hypothetical protein
MSSSGNQVRRCGGSRRVAFAARLPERICNEPMTALLQRTIHPRAAATA